MLKQNHSVLYGGLAQQEPSDENGVMARLRRLDASDERVCYPGQYDSDQVGEYLLLAKLPGGLLTRDAACRTGRPMSSGRGRRYGSNFLTSVFFVLRLAQEVGLLRRNLPE